MSTPSEAQLRILLAWGPSRQRAWRPSDLRSLDALRRHGLVGRVRRYEYELSPLGEYVRGCFAMVHDIGRAKGRTDSVDGGPPLSNLSDRASRRLGALAWAWPRHDDDEVEESRELVRGRLFPKAATS